MKTNALERLTITSLRLRRFVSLLLIAAPLVFAAQVLLIDPEQWLMLPPGITLGFEGAAFWFYPLLVLVSAIVPVLFWWILFELRSLIGLYAQGDVFTATSVDLLRKIGYLLMLVDPARMLQAAVTGPVVSSMGLTQPFLAVNLQISILVIGLFIVLVSRIMSIACEYYDLDRLTV